MRVGYLTTDPVNQATALQLAEEAGVTLCPLEPRDRLPDAPLAAVILDLDFLPSDLRRQLVGSLRRARPARATAVHSYNLDDAEWDALAANGVVVSSRLEADLMRGLCRSAAHAEATGRPEPMPVPGEPAVLVLLHMLGAS